MADPLSFLMADDPTAQEQAMALAQALQRSRGQGLALQALTGGAKAAPAIGAALAQGAQHQGDQLQQLSAQRIHNTMARAQQIAQEEARKQQFGLERERLRSDSWQPVPELGIKFNRRTGVAESLGLDPATLPGAAKEAARRIAATSDLRQEFQGLSAYKNAQIIAESAKKIKTTTDTGAGDLSLLYSYMRMVDPGSTVREGEFAQAASSGSLPQRIQGWAVKVLSGEKLPSAVRKQFKDEANTLLRAQSERYEETAKPYRRLATQMGAKPEDVVLDLGLSSLLGDGAPPGTQSGSVAQVTSDAEFDALPSGTEFVGPDGKRRRKP